MRMQIENPPEKKKKKKKNKIVKRKRRKVVVQTHLIKRVKVRYDKIM